MGCRTGLLGLALLASVGFGCSSSQPAAPPEGVADDSGAAPVSDNATPDAVVADFLEAIRTGKDERAGELLTKMARQKTEEMDMVVAPPGSESAAFEVGEVEMLPDDIAHVSSTWKDEGDTHEIVWALRKEPEGWRIAGMATKIFPDQELPLLLNFEDPEDMIRQQQLAEQEMIRRAQAESKKERIAAGEDDPEDYAAEFSTESEEPRQSSKGKRPAERQARKPPPREVEEAITSE
jgi:hypothetical protein